jgi:hypothetical protein
MLAWVVIHRRHFILSGMGEGHHQLARSVLYAHLFAFQPLTVRRSVTLLESTLEKVPHKAGLTTFRINTCKSVSKQRTLTTFRMNTYEKQGEGVSVIVNQTLDEGCLSRATTGSRGTPLAATKDSCPERALRDGARAGGALSGQDDSKAASSRSTPRGGRPLPEFFVGSFFGRGFASGLAFGAGERVF